MASQQINLYLKLGTKPSGSGRVRQSALLVGLVILGLGSYSGYLFYSSTTLNAAAQAVAAENRALQARVAALDAVQAGEAERLGQVLSELQAKRREQEQLVAMLAIASQGEAGGFSSVLLGLARQHQPGIVLSRIEAGERGASFVLAGSVDEASLVPVYLRRLGDESAFAGRAFDKVTLKAMGNRTAFEVQSNAPASGGS